MVQDTSTAVGTVNAMTVEIEWVLGAIILVIGSIMSFLLAMIMRLSRRVTTHDGSLGSVKLVGEKVDDVRNEMEKIESRAQALFSEAGRRLEKHEEREEKQFRDINDSINNLTIHVALLTGRPLRDHKEETNA